MPKVQTKIHKIIIVDDHPVLRDGLRRLIEKSKDYKVVGEAEDAEETIKLIVKHKPHIAIVDLTLKDTNGLELIRAIKSRFPSVDVLVYSMHEETIYAERVLRAGASGYLMKSEDGGLILNALDVIAAGDIYFSEESSKYILKKMMRKKTDSCSSPVDSLSNRELEIFNLIASGLNSGQISKKLSLSPNTIDSHRKNIKKKLNIKSNAELIHYAIQYLSTKDRDNF